ncbi:unnamed protein product [Orchesella dallaii]|uniref:Uncharacterized protein n=1 Tax=Orchesella dallaii TaxID=48710 RepID=A0ABP1S7K0_9HEXA
MEIKFQLRLQTILSWIHWVEKMERETMLQVLVGLLMTPFLISSLWSLSLTLIWHLIWLGVEAGLLLFLVGMGYYFLMKMCGAALNPKGNGRRRCSVGDVLLSILFQCGLRIPASIWGVFTAYFEIGMGAEEKNHKLALEFGEPEASIDEEQFWSENDSLSLVLPDAQVPAEGPLHHNPQCNLLNEGDSDSDSSLIHKILFEQMLNGRFTPNKK